MLQIIGTILVVYVSVLVTGFVFGYFPFNVEIYNFIFVVACGGVGLLIKSFSAVCVRKPINFSFLSPSVYFPLAFCLYYGVGGLTLTDYEEVVSPEVFYYCALGILAYQLGLFVEYVFNVPFSSKSYGKSFSSANTKSPRIVIIRVLSLLLIAVSIFSHLMIFKENGLLFLRDDFQDARVNVVSSVGGYVYYFALSAIDVIVVVCTFKIVTRQYLFKYAAFDIFVIVVFTLLLVQLGSRTRMIYPFLIVFIFYLYYSVYYLNKKISVGKVIQIAALVYAFLVVFGAYRYSKSEGVDYFDAVVHIMFGELNLVANTFNRILMVLENKKLFGLDLVIAPFAVLLPGKQQAFVDLLKETLGLTYSGGGFTPSMLGSLYLIWGAWSIVLGMMAWGVILAVFYRCVSRWWSSWHLTFIIVYAFLVVYSINAMKGGFFKDIEPLFHICILVVYSRFLGNPIRSMSR